MGTKTQDTLIREALEMAGNIGLTNRAQVWITDVLEDLYSQRDWPFLKKQMQYALSQGVASYNLMATGKPLETRRLYNVLRAELFLNGQFIRELDLKGAEEMPAYRDVTIQNVPAQGTPLQASFDVSGGPNAVTMLIFPPPDNAYTVNLVTHSVANAEVTYNGANPCLYPNDNTIMQGLIARVMKHKDDERQYTEYKMYKSEITSDVSKYGQGSGINQRWDLQKRTYGQPGNRYSTPWSWMGPV